MATDKIIISLIFVSLLLVAVFILGRCSKAPVSKEVIKHHIDTVYVVKSYKSDTIVQRARIIIRDTIQGIGNSIVDTLKVDSFMDSCYTALEEFITQKKDTVKIEYWHPERIFKSYINYSKDSTQIIRENTEITKYIEVSDPWWHKPVLILGGYVGGYIVGKVVK